MLSTEYSDFVITSDQSVSEDLRVISKEASQSRRMDIAMYGIVGETGSVLSAVKKRLLSEDGELMLLRPNSEIAEELGDTLWYCFLLDHLLKPTDDINKYSAGKYFSPSL